MRSRAAAWARRSGSTFATAAEGVGAQVGHPVGDGEVGLVTDAGDDGDAAARDGARDDLRVERPQVFEAPAAAHEQDEVDLGARGERVERRGDLELGALPLHARGPDHDRYGG